MAQRDPNKAARNKTIAKMKEELRTMVDTVMYEIDRDSELSVNAYIGSKSDDFIKLKSEVIRTPEEYVHRWLQGLDEGYKQNLGNRYRDMYEKLHDPANDTFRKYCELFLKRAFLNHYDELSKVRPTDEEAYYWFGLNDADYGLFVSPRFNEHTGDWENDKSEIRAFGQPYWTIGHVLATGLCIPQTNRQRRFRSVEEYLEFFYDLVRTTKSQYQLGLATRYIDFVRASATPLQVPLLIPEIRFQEGRKHLHRLDFLVINPYTMDKLGVELSPWSSHGQLSGKHKTLIELNDEAKANFEKEIKKVKAYYKKYGIYTFIYPDSELKDLDTLFSEIAKSLNPAAPPEQLSLHLIQDYFLKT